MILLLIWLLSLGRTSSKHTQPKLRRFKSDRDEIWQDCSSSKCA